MNRLWRYWCKAMGSRAYDDDKKDEINEQIEEVKKKNEDIEKENAKIARIKNKV